MQQRWWSVGLVHKNASFKYWAQCWERINRHNSLFLFLLFFLHKKEFVSKQLWVLWVITSVQPAAFCCEMHRGLAPVVSTLLVATVQWGWFHRQIMSLATCAAPLMLCHAVPGDLMTVTLYFLPSSLSWGGGGGRCWVSAMEEGPLKQSFMSGAQSLHGSGPRMGFPGILCQDGESQPWRLQSDVGPWLPKLVWWAQCRQHSRCFMSGIVRQKPSYIFG